MSVMLVDICPTDCINFMFNGPEDEVGKMWDSTLNVDRFVGF